MKKIFSAFIASIATLGLTTSCIEEILPQQGTVTVDQAASAPGAFDNFVSGLTSNLVGSFTYSGSDQRPWDFGYPSFYIQNDVMGQDMVPQNGDSEWYSTWYQCGVGLGPQYAVCQLPITYFYGWIKDCNNVLDMAGENIDEDKRHGAGIAYAMRALFYEDVARMYCEKSYAQDPQALATVVHVTQPWSDYYTSDIAHNQRFTNEKMWEFIISDLDKAEELLADYERPDKTVPDVSVVYGLKARAYLETCNWAKAKEYAKKAQENYRMMTAEEYTSRETGFNTPNDAWMMCVQFKDNDPNITQNDADSSWGSQMIIEITENSGCGYAANYVGAKMIDRHLYETMPETDIRRKCFIDFAIDTLATKEEKIEALKAYSDYPQSVYNTGYEVSELGCVGGINLKFRAAGGAAGHDNQYIGFTVAVPMMRVEEMILIEAEAAGMMNEAEGITLLTNFAKKRDPQYEYGNHNEAYGNSATPKFQNECWWQRRVEFWGEGLATYDIKRLGKGIRRSYANTNHIEGYRWNTNTPPAWMNRCFVQTETNYNFSITQNETPIQPGKESPESAW